MKQTKITENFGNDKCYFKLNSPFLAEKCVKWFETFTVYSTSIREALKLEKNDKYSICLCIFNKKWRSVGIRAGQTSTDKSLLRSSILKKLLATTFFIYIFLQYIAIKNITSFVYIFFTINQYTRVWKFIYNNLLLNYIMKIKLFSWCCIDFIRD